MAPLPVTARIAPCILVTLPSCPAAVGVSAGAGEGGNDLLHGRNQTENQKLERGNAALVGNIAVSEWVDGWAGSRAGGLQVWEGWSSVRQGLVHYCAGALGLVHWKKVEGWTAGDLGLRLSPSLPFALAPQLGIPVRVTRKQKDPRGHFGCCYVYDGLVSE